jgi:filamentous hemagglutinin family protein
MAWAVCLLTAGPGAWALPQGAVPSFGQTTVQQTAPGTLLIQQSSTRAGLDWSSFSIAAGERVNIVQPSSNAVLLNRVVGHDPSLIHGAINSNGAVWLINPRGIVFGATSRVDVGGLLASTLTLSPADAALGRIPLRQGHESAAEIRAEGQISAPGGLIVLVAPQVKHSGTVNAARVGMAAASEVLVDVEGDGLIFFNVKNRDLTTRLDQLGQVRADGGTADLRAAARAGFADTVLNLDGVVQARGLGQRGGRIVIDGGADGITRLAGTVDATASVDPSSNATSLTAVTGGSILVQGKNLLLEPSARLDVSGSAGGGDLRVGGDFQGRKTDVRNANMVTVREGARLSANALDNGTGGTVIVWSDVATRFAGQADARGGQRGGDGGLVEVSGKGHLDFRGSSDRQAPLGRAGTLLLDPTDIEVELNAPDIDGSNSGIDLGGPSLAFGDFGATSRITAAAVVGQLNAGNVTLQAQNNITVNAAVDASATAAISGLTLQAGNNIFVNAPIRVRGNLVLSASDAGAPLTPSPLGRVETVAALRAGGNISLNNGGLGGVHRLGADISANTLAITGGADLTSNGLWTLASNSSVSGGLSGVGGLTKSGSGVLTLSGINTYSGATTLQQGGLVLNSALASTSVAVNAGTMTVGATDVLPDGAALAVANGATLSMSATDTVASLALAGTLSGGAALSVSGATSLTGGQVDSPLNTGSLVNVSGSSVLRSDVNTTTTTLISAGRLTVGDGATAGSLTTGGSLTVSSGAVLAYDRSDNITLGDTVLGTGSLQHTGTGTLTFNGSANSLSTLQVTAPAGNLVLGIGSGARIGNSTAVTVNSNATLTLGDSSETVGSLTLAGTLVANPGDVLTAATTTLQSGATVNASLGAGTVNVTGNSSLNRASTSTSLNVNNGTLTLGGAGLLSTGTTVTVAGGATLALGGNDSIGPLNLAGSVTGAGTLNATSLTANGTGAVLASSLVVSNNASVGSGSLTVGDGATFGSLTVGGTLTVSTGAVLAFSRSDNFTLSDSILGGGTLRHAGTGSLTFTGSANSLSSLQVTSAGGNLVLGNGSGTRIGNSTAVTVASGATLTMGNTDETVGVFSLAGTLDGSARLRASATTLLTGAVLNADLGNGNVTVSGSAIIQGDTQGDISVGPTGALVLGASSSLGSGADISVATGGTLTLGRDSSVNKLTLAGLLDGAFTMTTASGASGGTTLQNGALVALNTTLAGGTVTVTGDATLNGRSIAPQVQINNGGTLHLGPTADRLIDSSGVSFPRGGTASSRVLQLAVDETVSSLSGSGTLQGPGTLSSPLLALTDDNFNTAGPHSFGALTSSGTSSITDGVISISGPATVLDGVLTVGNGGTRGQLVVAGITTIQPGATLAYDRSDLVTVTTPLSGTGTLRQEGSGELRIGSSVAASQVQVNRGILSLSLGNDDRLADGAIVNVANGATLTLNNLSEFVGALTLAGSLNGTGTLTAASYTLNAGATASAPLGAGALTVGGNSTLSSTSAANTVQINAGTLTLGGANRLLSTTALSVANGGALLLNGNQTVATLDLGGTLDKTGASDRLSANTATLQAGGVVNADLASTTLAVNGNSTLHGLATAANVTIQNGTLTLGSANRLANTADVVVSFGAGLSLGGLQTVNTLSTRGSVAGSGHTLQANAYSLDSGANISANLGSNAVTVLGDSSLTGSMASSAVTIGAGNLSTSGNNRLASGATVTVAGNATLTLGGNESIDTLVLTGNLSGSGRLLSANTYSLQTGGTASANLGSGVLTVAGNSNLNGTAAVSAVNLSSGALTLGAAGRFTASPAVSGNGTLVLGGNETVGSLVGNGSVNLGAFTLSTGSAGSTSFGGIISGSGGLSKLGAATTFTLNGSQSYSGTTSVTQGTLVLGAPELLADSSAVAVASGATLRLTGTETVASLSLAGNLSGTGTLIASSQLLSGGNTALGADLGAGTLTSQGNSSLGGGSAASSVNVTSGTLTLLAPERLADNANIVVATGAALAVGSTEQVGALNLSGTLAGAGNTLQASSYSLGSGAVVNADLGSGVLSVAGSSTLNGRANSATVNVSSGTLTLGPLADRLSDSAAVTVAAIGTLTLSNNETVASLNLAGGLSGSGLTLTSSGNITLLAGAAVSANLAAATLDVNGSTSLSGTVSAANINVNSGRLSLAAADRLADNATVNVASSADLQLNGNDTVQTLNLSGNLLGSGTLTTTGTTHLLGGSAVANLGGSSLTSTGGGTLGGTSAATSLQVNSGTLTLAGANRLTGQPAVALASGGTITLSGEQTWGPLSGTGNINLGSATLTLTGAASSTFGGSIAGSGNLAKQGTGALTLGGSHSYAGSTTVGQGTLLLASANVLPDSSAVVVASSATLNLSGNDSVASLTLAGTLSGNGVLSASSYALQSGLVTSSAGLGTGTLTSQGNSNLAGTAAAGTVSVNGGTLTLAGTNRLASNAQLSVAGGATLKLEGPNSVDQLTLAGQLDGSAQTLSTATSTTLQTGAQVMANLVAPALVVTGDATLAGVFGGAGSPSLTVSSGTLTLASADRLADTVAVAVSGGATLALNGDDRVGSLTMAGSLNGVGSNLSAPLFNLQAGASVLANLGAVGTTTLNVHGNTSLSGSADANTINVNAGTLSLNGPNRLSDTADVLVARGATLLLAGDDRVGSLTLSGTLGGVGVLTATNYNLTGGIYNLDLGGGALNSSGISQLNGASAAASLNVTGGTLTLGSANRFNANPAVAVAAGATLILGGDQAVGSLSGAGAVDLSSFRLDTGQGSDSTFAGTLSGSGGLTKSGTSTFTLTGNNSYTGLTRVEGGRLAVQGSMASGQWLVNTGLLGLGAPNLLADNAALTVATGAQLTLNGDDTVGSLTLAGTLGGSGRLTASSYALNSGVVNVDLGPGVLTSNGASSVDGGLSTGAVGVAGGSLTLGSNGRLSGAAVHVASGASLTLGGDDTVAALTGGGSVLLSTFTLGLTGTSNSTFAGSLTGSGELVKYNSATFSLGGANRYTGSTRVLAGTLVLAGASASQAVVVGPGATLELSGANLLHDNAHLNVQNGGTARLNGNETVGSLAVSGTLGGSGRLTAATYGLENATVTADLGPGALSSAGASVLIGQSAASTVVVGRGSLTLGSASRLSTGAAVTVSPSTTLVLGGDTAVSSLLLQGSASGSGTLSAAQYMLDGGTANVQLGSGVLQSRGNSLINADAAVGNIQVGTGTLTLGSNARLSATPALVLDAAGSLDLGSDQTLGTLAGSGRVGLNSFTLSTGTRGDSVYTGVISGSGGLSKVGLGTFTLDSFQPNGFTGTTQVLAGTLATGRSHVLAQGSALSVAAGATLTLGGSDSVASLSLAGTLGGNGTLSAGRYNLIGGTVTADLGSGTLSSTGNSRLDGRSAASTITVGGGTLVLGSANRLSALPALTVDSGARLALVGDQTLGALSGEGSVDLASFTLRTGVGADSTFAGSVAGSGGLVKQGGTTFALTGANTFSGTTHVQGGTLRVGDGARAGSLASQAYVVEGTLSFARNDTVQLSQPVSGAGGIEQAGSGQLLLSGGNKSHTGATVVSAGRLSTSGDQDLSTDSSVSVATGARLDLLGQQTVRSVSAQGSVQLNGNLSATQDLVLNGAVTTTGATTLSGQRIDAIHADNVWGGPVSLLAGGPVALSSGRLGSTPRDLVLGQVQTAAGGRIEAGHINLSAPLLVSGGTLVLEAVGARVPLAPDATLVGKRAAGSPIIFAADVVQQSAASVITVASGAGLRINATGGGSVQLQSAANSVAGSLSVISGSPTAPWSVDPTTATFAGLPAQTYALQSRVRLAGNSLNIGGGQLAAGTAGEAGVLADVIHIRADRLSTTGPGSTLVARLPFDSTIGTSTSIAALTLELTPQSYSLSFPFGGTGDGALRVNVGSKAWGNRTLPLDAGYITALPRGGARGSTAVLLSGPTVVLNGYRFFFDGAGSQNEIPVLYNGVLPTTPQVENSISATVAVSENARKDRFDESVRTENVTVRLRNGVIAEVGPAPSATQGAQGILPPPSCAPELDKLSCTRPAK